MSVEVLQTVDMSGMEYVAPRGKQKGNMMIVLGPDKDFLLEDRWLVKSLKTGDVWSVFGYQLREFLKDKIEQRLKRQQEIQQKKEQVIISPVEVKPEKRVADKSQPEWMNYDIEEFVNAELVLSFYSKLLQDWLIIISHKGMYESHKEEIQAEFKKHSGVVYTIDELNDLVGVSTDLVYLKNYHLLKKTFLLRYERKTKNLTKGEML